MRDADEHGPGSRRRGDVAIAPRHSARAARERTQRSPARALALEPRPAALRRAPAPRRPTVAEGRTTEERTAGQRAAGERAEARSGPRRPTTTATAAPRREPRGRPTDRREPRPRTGLVLVLALGVLLAMGTVLVVFAGGQEGPAPAAAAPASVAAAPAALPPAPTPLPAAPAGPVALTPAELARCPATSVACVDLAGHTAWLQRDGKVISGPVEMLPGADTFHRPPGPESSATPAGTFHVLRKERDGFSTEFHEPMNHAVYFAPGGIAFHEGSLTTSSNGCIHLAAPDATAFFDALEVGDGVTTF